MKLSIAGENFYQNGARTYTEEAGFPNADERLEGLLLNHRVINGIFDDLNEDRDYDGDGRDDWAYPDSGEWDAERNTQQFVEAMSDWRACGVIAFTIGLQGGNPFPTSPPPDGLSTRDLDCGAFNPDGSLRPAFMQRLRRVLHEAERLDMVPIINYFYQGGNRRIREEAIGTAIDNATRWLLEQGYDRLIIDLANECDASAYWPTLQLPNIHEMIYRVKDAVTLHNNATGHARTFYVGASFTGAFSIPENLRDIPASFMRAVDLLLPHGNKRSTKEIAGAIDVLRERTEALARKPLPIVYNEDTQAVDEDAEDTGGDLEHLQVCLDAHVSWGNLIRSHQRVPCKSWFEGTPVQRRWFETTRELAGEPEPPRSVHTFYHRI